MADLCTKSPWWHIAMTSIVTSCSFGSTILPLSLTYNGYDDALLTWSVFTSCAFCASCNRFVMGQCSGVTIGIRSGPAISMSLILPFLDIGISCGFTITICGAALATASSKRCCLRFSSVHVLTALLHPFLDSRSQKLLSSPGMCTVSNEYDLRYSAHLRSLSLAATDIVDALVGSSNMYDSALWSFTDANLTSPTSRCLCRSTAYLIGYASLHDILQLSWWFLNLPEFTASSSCFCSSQGFSSSPGSHCVIT